MEDQALCFFFGTYATSQLTGHQASFCAQLPNIYRDMAEDHTLKQIIFASWSASKLTTETDGHQQQTPMIEILARTRPRRKCSA